MARTCAKTGDLDGERRRYDLCCERRFGPGWHVVRTVVVCFAYGALLTRRRKSFNRESTVGGLKIAAISRYGSDEGSTLWLHKGLSTAMRALKSSEKDEQVADL